MQTIFACLGVLGWLRCSARGDPHLIGHTRQEHLLATTGH
jgi:hypothetical protein